LRFEGKPIPFKNTNMNKLEESKESKGGCSTIIIGIIITIVILLVANAIFSDPAPQSYQKATESNKKIFTFTLTHALGQKLPKDATFTCGDTPVWILNMNNGSKLKYTIISTDSDGSLCGIKAVDNLGDNCEICIISEGDGKMALRLRYGERTMVYKGYAN
jgi:hypothetical protein